MHVGFGFNPMSFARIGGFGAQAKVNQQISVAGAGSAYSAQDCLVKKSQRARSMQLVSKSVGQRRVLDKAGVTKVAAAKKR